MHTHHHTPLPAFGMLMLILVLAALDQTILATALPVMARELPGHWPLAWAFSAYLLAATVVIALYGRLADVLGRKFMLLFALGLFFIGSLACGASQDLQQLVLARVCQGAGGGGLMTLSMLAVIDLFPPERRGRYQGLLGASYGMATMFGPLLGGALVEHLSWHWAFWINVPLALIAWGVLAWRLPKHAPHADGPRPSIDWLGALLLSVALVSLLLATQHAKLHLPETLSLGLLLTLGAAFALAFLWRQSHAAHPMLPLSLFTHPAYAAVSFLGLSSGVCLYAAVVLLPQYLQTGLNLAPTTSAWYLLPMMTGITAAAVISGKRLRSQHAHLAQAHPLARLACLLILLSVLLIEGALHWQPDMPLLLSIGMLPMGLGLGILFPVITMVAQQTSPKQHMGIATAAPIMLRSLGGAAGVALLAALLTRLVEADLAAQRPLVLALSSALQPVFLCIFVVAWMGLYASSKLAQRTQ